MPGLKGGRTHLVFRSGGARYQIRLAEVCVETKRGWVLFPEARWYGRVED